MQSFKLYKDIPAEEKTRYTWRQLAIGLTMMIVAGGIILVAINAFMSAGL